MDAVRTFQPGDEDGLRAVMEASLASDAIPGFVRADIRRTLAYGSTGDSGVSPREASVPLAAAPAPRRTTASPG